MRRNFSKIELEELADKVIRGTATDEEYKLLNEWYKSFDDSEVVLEASETKSQLQRRLWGQIHARTLSSRKSYPVMWKWAAVIALVLTPVMLIFHSRDTFSHQEEALTMASQRTEPGQKKTVRLPDGTIIKLNSGSVINYPENFSGNKRSVELMGEAFFEVARDESRPFVITTHDIRVEVLGTSFNVKAFAGDPQIDVAVKSGKVAVRDVRSADSLTLLPDEMVSCTVAQAAFEKRAIMNHALVFGWAEGALVFDDESLEEVFGKISRWYGVEVDLPANYESFVAKKITATCKDLSLNEVLQGLSHSCEFDYELKGKQVKIKTR